MNKITENELFCEMQTLAESMQVQIAFKDESAFMCALGRILFFNKRFMTDFTTTWGKTVYFPTRAYVEKNLVRSASILAHELVHVQDQQDLGTPTYLFMYASPQAFAVLSLLSLLAIPYSLWWLCSLASLAALAPWPAKGRAYLEFRGYAMTMACKRWLGETFDTPPDWIVRNFTGPAYLRMAPDGNAVRMALETWLTDIKDGKLGSKISIVSKVQPIFEAYRVRQDADKALLLDLLK
jgi:hypothetical protein